MNNLLGFYNFISMAIMFCLPSVALFFYAYAFYKGYSAGFYVGRRKFSELLVAIALTIYGITFPFFFLGIPFAGVGMVVGTIVLFVSGLVYGGDA